MPPTVLLRPAGLCHGEGDSCTLIDDDFTASDTSSPTRDSPPHRTSRYLDHEEKFCGKRACADHLTLALDTLISGLVVTFLTEPFFVLILFLCSNKQHRCIPPSIADLSNFFNTPRSLT